MRFPPSFIERLRSQSRVSEVIGKRITLKKHGREFQGLCPFHNEKTPSFTVNDDKNFFHCFGCGAHGDAIEFVRRYERMSYPEAIESLARDIGLPLPQMDEFEIRRARAEKTLLDVLEAACQFYEKQINSGIGAPAMEYVKSRGLTPETIRNFRIGFASDQRTALHEHLNLLGFTPKLQSEANLITIPDSGKPYDRFRGRVMFPIRNASGKVIAFGGRLMGTNSNKSLPKYLNSAESPVFKKREMVYNLDQAKQPGRQAGSVIVMEGYMDVVACSQYGVKNSVATLGTAVSPDHLRLLWQVAGEPVMCLDGDNAGMRAMMRTVEVALPLLRPGFSLRFAVLPKGEDPDSYIQKHGKASFDKLVSASMRLSQMMWEHFAPQYNLNTPEDRASLEQKLKTLTAAIADNSVRTHYQSYFNKMLWQKSKDSKGKAPQANAPTRSRQIEQLMHKAPTAAFDMLAKRLINVVLRHPTFLLKSNVEDMLADMEIRNPQLDAVRLTLLTMADDAQAGDGDALIAKLQARLPGIEFSTILLGYIENISAEDATYLWDETVSAYQIAHIEHELDELRQLVSQDMDEAQYHRMIELQQALVNARQTRNFAPEESDIL